jgi:hypothetical protein
LTRLEDEKLNLEWKWDWYKMVRVKGGRCSSVVKGVRREMGVG